MTHALDYATCIALIGGASPELVRRFLSFSASEIGVPAIVRAELLLTAKLSQRPQENTRTVNAFLEPLVNLPFDLESADEYALLRSELGPQEPSLGAHDLLTAATALGHRLTLVVRNPAVFASVTRLKLETWT